MRCSWCSGEFLKLLDRRRTHSKLCQESNHNCRSSNATIQRPSDILCEQDGSVSFRQLAHNSAIERVFLSPGANPWRIVDQIRNKLRMNAAAVNTPIGLEDQFKGVVDLVRWKAVYNEGVKGYVLDPLARHHHELIKSSASMSLNQTKYPPTSAISRGKNAPSSSKQLPRLTKRSLISSSPIAKSLFQILSRPSDAPPSLVNSHRSSSALPSKTRACRSFWTASARTYPTLRRRQLWRPTLRDANPPSLRTESRGPTRKSL